MPRYDRLINPGNQATIERVNNATGTAEGSVLPPRQVGPTRVPIITELRLLNQFSATNINFFTLVWNEPIETLISGYRIYYQIGNNSFISNTFCNHSPAVVPVVFQTSEINLPITFAIQTVLKNGFLSDLSLSPTASGKLI